MSEQSAGKKTPVVRVHGEADLLKSGKEEARVLTSTVDLVRHNTPVTAVVASRS